MLKTCCYIPVPDFKDLLPIMLALIYTSHCPISSFTCVLCMKSTQEKEQICPGPRTFICANKNLESGYSPSCLGGTEKVLSCEKIFFFSSINSISAANRVTQFWKFSKIYQQNQRNPTATVCGLLWEQVHDPPFPFLISETELTET